VHVDEQRLVSGAQDAFGREEEPRAAGAAQELAAGGGQQVAADLDDVDGVLADRLAGVGQVQQVQLAAVLADLGDGLDQAGVGGDVGGGDQPGAVRR
jgi:hypothetical protein